MEFTKIWRSPRGEGGFSTMGMLTAVAGVGALTSLILMNGTEQVSAAETSACQYEKSIILTALDSYRLLEDDLAYPAAAGDDGLDEVRAAGWLKSEAGYWTYIGVDATNAPQFELQRPIPGCE